jgi:hypothetical protein
MLHGSGVLVGVMFVAVNVALLLIGCALVVLDVVLMLMEAVLVLVDDDERVVDVLASSCVEATVEDKSLVDTVDVVLTESYVGETSPVLSVLVVVGCVMDWVEADEKGILLEVGAESVDVIVDVNSTVVGALIMVMKLPLSNGSMTVLLAI